MFSTAMIFFRAHRITPLPLFENHLHFLTHKIQMRFAPLLVVFIFSACAIPVPLLDPGSRQLAEPDKDVIFPSAGSDQPSPSLNAATILALSIESPLPSLGSDSRLIAESDKAVLPHDSISPFSGLEPEKRSPQPIDPSLHLTADTTVLSHSIESSDSRVKRAIDEPSSEKDAAASLGAEIVLPPMATEPTHSLEIVHHTANETVVDLETALALDPPLEIGILPTDDVNESIAPEIAHSVEIGTPLLSPNVSDATAAPETAHSLDSTFESVTTPVNNETDERNDSTLATLSNETAPALPVTTPASELGIRALLPLLPDLLNLIPVQNSSFDSFWKQSKINFAVSSYAMNILVIEDRIASDFFLIYPTMWHILHIWHVPLLKWAIRSENSLSHCAIGGKKPIHCSFALHERIRCAKSVRILRISDSIIQ